MTICDSWIEISVKKSRIPQIIILLYLDLVVQMCPKLEKMLFIYHQEICPSLLPIAGNKQQNLLTKNLLISEVKNVH